MKRPFSIYLITDPAYDVIPITRAALVGAPPGTVAVQARDRAASPRQLTKLARALLPICRDAGAALLVNDRADVARAVGADGVHLPERGISVADARAVLGENQLVGCSRHSHRGLMSTAGADFATLGPIGEVPGKRAPMGVDGFAAACEGAPTLVYGLGGVNADIAGQLRARGAAGVAVMRAVYAADDPAAGLAALIAAVSAS